MDDKQQVIENYNYQAIDAYKRKLKEKRDNDGSSPTLKAASPDGKYSQAGQLDLNLMQQLMRTQPEREVNSAVRASPMLQMRATVGGTKDSSNGTTSKALENMLNNCCVLTNIRQLDSKAVGISNRVQLSI